MSSFSKFIKSKIKYSVFIATMLYVALISSSDALSIPALDLRSMDSFTILAGSAITGVPTVSMTGNVGLSPAAGSYIAGFDGSNVTGILYVVDASGPAGSVINSTLLQTAKSDLTIAYNDAAGRTPVPTGTFLNPGSGNIGGLSLVAGLYKFTSDCAITGSDVTLTGSSTDVWIFQIASSLNLGSGIHVILGGQAQAANIFWQVGTSATLGTYSVFKGSILADQSVSLGTGASMDGRALAFSGAVTMSSGVTSTKPVLLSGPIFSSNLTQLTFGNVSNGSTKRDSVTVTNTGTSDLIISTITSNNTVYTVTPSNGTISAGSSRKFYVTFAPLSDSLKNGKIYFNHNATNLKDSITVSGSGISPRFTVNPTNINFGNLNIGMTKRDSVTVTNTGLADLIISTITSNNTVFTITPSNGTIKPDSSKKYYITFAPLSDSLKNGKIYFNHNATNLKDSITVSGTGISPRFSVTPTNINFGNLNIGFSKRDSVTVTNTGTANLVLSSITSSNSSYSILPAAGIVLPGTSQKFYISFAPLTDGLKSAKIYFNHNAPNLRDSITVSGTGVSPRFSMTPLSINFGNVDVGSSKTDSVLISNSGTADLIISSISNTNLLFSISPTNSIIAPGSSRKLYVTFEPYTPGLQNGKFIINHNAISLRDTLNVSGFGAAAVFAVNPMAINFNDVNIGLTKRDSVIVTNNGNANLIITSLVGRNLVFAGTPATATILPGATKKFYITFSPIVDGQLNSYIIFNHNGMNGRDSIGVAGKGVSPKFTVNPRELLFGNVNSGTTKIDSVTVTNTGTNYLIISSVISNNQYFTIGDQRATIAPGQSQKYYITFTPLKAGFQEGYIKFRFNATNAVDSIYVSGIGVGNDLTPKFTITPKNLDFGLVNSGTTKTDSVTITNIGTANLVISGFYSSNVFYKINPLSGIIAPNTSKKFYVTFAPLVPGTQDGYAYFYHNDPNGKDSIHVTGIGVGNDLSPKFSANPVNLDFGNVFIGTPEQKSVLVTNKGLTDLEIWGVASTDYHYTVTPVIATIPPGGSLDFFITFSPTVIGQLSAKVLFSHNAGNDTINVTGNGIDLLTVVTIKEARELPLGTEFAIEGTVTRAMGSYTRIQDQTGAITIQQDTGKFYNDVENYDIQIGDSIHVRGIISEVASLKVIKGLDLTGYHRISRLNDLPIPQKVTLMELANNGELYESKLITVDNMAVNSEGDFYYLANKSYQTTDASDISNEVVIRIGKEKDTEMDNMPFLSQSVKFVGVLSQSSFNNPSKGYQLTPVLPTDLRFVTDVLESTTNDMALYDNYPNPFNSTTIIQYKIGSANFVTLKVLDVLGKEVVSLVNRYQDAGTYSVSFSNDDKSILLGNGIYFYRLQVGTSVSTKQMIFLK